MASIADAPLRVSLKFLADRSAPLAYVASKGGGDRTRHLGNFRSEEVAIQDARTALSVSDLDREGFMLLAHESAVTDFYDDDALRTIYHGEITALIRRASGARRVEVFDDTRRSSSVALQRERGIREPATIVHNDYTERSAARRLAEFSRTESADRRPPQRFAIINAWRPIGATVVDQPLALCDASTVDENDLVAVERRAADRTGELQVALHAPRQRWYFYSRMHRGEVLLFKTYDSARDGRARFTPHTAFRCPDADDTTPPRESLETRCLALF